MVLFTLAGIAQFERKQVSERVRAGFASRASRGLFNGGAVPLGYSVDPKLPGHLAINDEMADVVRRAFTAFLEHGSLTQTAKWLNENGYRVQRKTVCGRSRLGFFIFDNLHSILTNKAYIGIRCYRDFKGKSCETQAAWPALISPELFERVQLQLRKNHCRLKPPSARNRYPYLLSGLLKCGSCGDALPGRSANGNGGKIPYYEHSWATKRGAAVVRDTFRCDPHRVLAARLEPLVWGLVMELLTRPEIARRLIEEAHRIHAKRQDAPESERLRKRVQGYTLQVEALTERLGELPKGVSAEPIFSQMKKLQALKADTDALLLQSEGSRAANELPASLTDYERLISALRTFDGLNPDKLGDRESCRKLINRLIHKIEIFSERARVHYFAGRDYVQTELLRTDSLPATDVVPPPADAGAEVSTISGISAPSGSTTLTNGA